MKNTKRLFIAIDLPEQVKKYLSTLQSEVSSLAKTSGTQLALARDFHLTLKFLGSCDEEETKAVARELAEIPCRSFDLALEKIGAFGGNHPRVIWIGIRAPQILFEMARTIAGRMERLGFPEEDDFTPHVTLARVRKCPHARKFLEHIGGIEVEPMAFPINYFYLFESRLSSAGAIYLKLRKPPSSSRGDNFLREQKAAER